MLLPPRPLPPQICFYYCVQVHNQPLTSLLGDLLGTYNYTLPRLALGRGLAYVGGAARLRRVVRHLLSRQSPPRSVKVGLIGGRWGRAGGGRIRGEWNGYGAALDLGGSREVRRSVQVNGSWLLHAVRVSCAPTSTVTGCPVPLPLRPQHLVGPGGAVARRGRLVLDPVQIHGGLVRVGGGGVGGVGVRTATAQFEDMRLPGCGRGEAAGAPCLDAPLI